MSSSPSATSHRKIAVLLEPGQFSEGVFRFLASKNFDVVRADTRQTLLDLLSSDALVIDPSKFSEQEFMEILDQIHSKQQHRNVQIISSSDSAEMQFSLRSKYPKINFAFLTEENAMEMFDIIYDRVPPIH